MRYNEEVTDMKKKLYTLLYVIMILLLVWIFASFVNVNAHNKFGDYQYWDWNFFIVVFRKIKAW